MCDNAHRANRVLSLFEAYERRVYSFARQSLPPGQAEDVVQEVFVRLLEHPRLEELEISAAYVIKIADNLIRRNYLRARKFREVQDRLVQNMMSSGRVRPVADDDDATRTSSATRAGTCAGPGVAGGGTGGSGGAGSPVADVRREAIDHAFRRLNEREQATLRFIVVQDLTYQDAANAMGVRVTTVNNWKHRAVMKARNYATEFVATR